MTTNVSADFFFPPSALTPFDNDKWGRTPRTYQLFIFNRLAKLRIQILLSQS